MTHKNYFIIINIIHMPKNRHKKYTIDTMLKLEGTGSVSLRHKVVNMSVSSSIFDPCTQCARNNHYKL